MKKVFLIVACAMMLVFALVVSASAQELQNDKGIYYSTSNEFGTVNTLDEMTAVTSSVKTDAENYTTTYYATHSLEQRVVLANGDGTFSTYPTAYIMNLNNSDWKMMALNPAKINAHTGYEYTMESIIRLELPEGIRRIGHDERGAINIKSAVNCVYLSIPASFDSSSGTQMGSAFSGMTSLVTIDMSKCTKLTSILSGWFNGCTSLTTILWPQSGLKSINNGSFKGCTSLTTVVIPEGVDFPAHTQNDYGAFGACTSLTTVTLPSSVTNLHKRIFDGCTSLTTINLPEGLTAVQDQAFRGTALTSISIPSTLTTIGNYMFQNCKQLAEVEFNGTNLKTFGTAPFENCTSLTSIVLPEGLVTLGNCAFKGCKGLTSVTLPTTLTTLEGGEHFYNTALTEVIGLENTQLTSISASMFRGLSKWKPDVIKLPNTVTSIGNYGFADVGMKTMILSAELTTFPSSEAFVNCKYLERVYLPGTITSFGTRTFNNNQRSDILFIVTSIDSTYLESMKSSYSCASIVSYADYLASPDTYAKGRILVSGYNVCDAFYDSKHVLDEEKSNACAGICANCALVTPRENPVHNTKTTIAYANGFNTSGTKTVCCLNENCPLKTTPEVTSIDAIFEGFVYSTREENGSRYGIVLSYGVNQEALEAYQTNTGKTVSYGVVAIAQQGVNGNPLENDGTPKVESIITTDVTGTPSVDLIIWGSKAAWETELDDGTTVADIDFYILGYAVENGSLDYFYGEASSADITALTALSYNDIKAM